MKKLASSKRLQEVVAHQISKKKKKKLVRDAQNWGIYSNVLTQNTIRENEWMATMPTVHIKQEHGYCTKLTTVS